MLLTELGQLRQNKPSATRTAAKRYNWLLWASRCLERRGKATNFTMFCGYGNIHIVGTDVVSIGGGSAFKSHVCSGCPVGAGLLPEEFTNIAAPVGPRKRLDTEKYTNTVDLEVTPQLPCFLCDNYYLLTEFQVSPGDVVAVPTFSKRATACRVTDQVAAEEREKAILYHIEE